ncbi:hypothetical protein GPECTOR_41g705 [Gonium pectorale]|uniref:Uncharacterized protein n=1 Tax=Gonium pectorale TaxID=33097 RepID=A0A150GBJ9_GONPE|nr:hypothetical protein GPECTOR_41g705 [Gonium pectorale]|eukprot:KXZ46740.1 hypothetical protein GPECTOR_41g705 [Gonium pectorale]
MEHELKHLGFDVVASDGQPELTGSNAPDAYVIPTQIGHAFYTAVEDMSAVASYLAEGGLVVVLDANHGQGEALSSFVSTALGYQGKVSGAFGKVGVSGAIVWVGYSWRDGEQAQWGSLLRKLIQDFADGAYEAPKQGNAKLHPLHVDSVLEAAVDLAEAVEMKDLRIAFKASNFVQDDGGVDKIALTYAIEDTRAKLAAAKMQEVHAEFYHTVRRFLQKFNADQLEIGMQIFAQGAAGRTRSVVWNTDTDFLQQIAPLAPLQLVDPKKAPCPTTCTACPRTWKGTNTSISVAIFFKEPVQATAVFIKQIRNPGIIRVQFIKWVYPPKGELGANVGKTVYNVTNDPTVCQSVLSIRIGPVQSGIKSAVPASGTQARLPRVLARTAVGGLLITVDRPQRAGPNYGPFLEWVKVSGRVLYPSDPTVYAGQR